MIGALLFWSSIGVVAYTYAGYPLLVAALAQQRGRAPREADLQPPLTVVVAAYNEQSRIAGRVHDILAQDYPAHRLRVLVVSDGSNDCTAREAALDDSRVSVLALPHNVGKAQALNLALEQVDTELVAFTDARQRYGEGALRALVAPFADADVGAVSGDLVLEPATGAGHEVGLYWRMEKALRADEARLGWLHGVSGAVYALRRELFEPLPAGTVLDDMWVPLHVLLAGRRVWMARTAIAYDQSSADATEEFHRKLRTLAGNWQLLARLPVLMDPTRNPVFFAWFSHKFLRLLVPWALLVALFASALTPGWLYRLAFIAQLLGYAWAIAGLRLPRLAARVPLLPAAGTFLMLNLAALLSLPASLAWHPSRLWKKH
ncbi:glycosyltransferase family 2 protein [Lysobacter cavernae]|uniref:Glycosyltransferase family 2 protein n=1 Tax=Lysobacter cavernae TaxID=1685901 RepID=A0ABV7RM53_9GAMM